MKEVYCVMINSEPERFVEMFDDEGNKTTFEHLMTLDYQNKQYVALGSDTDDEEATDVIIARIDKDENGQDVYVTEIPEDILNTVFDMAVELIEAEEDGGATEED